MRSDFSPFLRQLIRALKQKQTPIPAQTHVQIVQDWQLDPFDFLPFLPPEKIHLYPRVFPGRTQHFSISAHRKPLDPRRATRIPHHLTLSTLTIHTQNFPIRLESQQTPRNRRVREHRDPNILAGHQGLHHAILRFQTPV